MIRKTALLLALFAAAINAQSAQARTVRCRPHRVFVQPRPVVYVQQPCYYYPQPYAYYPAYSHPVYPQPVSYYVDYRNPKVAAVQDGMNFFLNAISCSRG